MKHHTLILISALFALLCYTGCAHTPCACGEKNKETAVQKTEESKPKDPPPNTAEKDCKTATEQGECALTPEELKELKEAAAKPKTP